MPKPSHRPKTTADDKHLDNEAGKISDPAIMMGKNSGSTDEENSDNEDGKISDPVSKMGKKTGNADDICLPIDKLNLGPKKKLLVLSLGGLLAYRVHSRAKSRPRRRADVTCGAFLFFQRPFCTEFLKFCFARFDVAIWSSTKEHNVNAVLSRITDGEESKFVFVWEKSECTDTGIQLPQDKKNPLLVKDLKSIWEHESYAGLYSASNTLLIDVEPQTALLNLPGTGIFPEPYEKDDLQDTFLGPGSELREYLNGVVDAGDVPSYVEGHPFGQAPISENHPDWNYYEKVATVGKVDDNPEEATSKLDVPVPVPVEDDSEKVAVESSTGDAVVQTRKSTRVVKKPDYLKYYVL